MRTNWGVHNRGGGGGGRGGIGKLLIPLLAKVCSYLEIVEGGSTCHKEATIIQLPYSVMYDFIPIFNQEREGVLSKTVSDEEGTANIIGKHKPLLGLTFGCVTKILAGGRKRKRVVRVEEKEDH